MTASVVVVSGAAAAVVVVVSSLSLEHAATMRANTATIASSEMRFRIVVSFLSLKPSFGFDSDTETPD
jgi:hypothetical protein